ncbi:hypothetical protein OROMI_002701 [Orobanche minor]
MNQNSGKTLNRKKQTQPERKIHKQDTEIDRNWNPKSSTSNYKVDLEQIYSSSSSSSSPSSSSSISKKIG